MEALENNGAKPLIEVPEHAVVCCDANENIISWDVQAEKMFGWQYSEALGKNLFRLILGDEASTPEPSRLSSAFREQRENAPITRKIRERARHRNNRSFPIELIISPSPNREHATIFIRNISGMVAKRSVADGEVFNFEIISTILKMSLGPAPLKDRLEHILAFLVSVKELDLSPMAALFLAEQDSQVLSLNIQHGLTYQQQNACKLIPFGHCHCGQAAQTNAMQVTEGVSEQHFNPDPTHNDSYCRYCLPFGTHGIVTGVLCLFASPHHKISRQKESLLGTITEIVGKIIETQKMDLQLINLVNDLRGSIIELREEKKFTESIIQGLEHGLVITDHQGTIQKCNDVAKNILRPFAQKLDGQSLDAVIGSENARKIFTFDHTKDPSEEKELPLRMPNGDELVLRYSAVEKKDSLGKPGGAIISLTDISEWRHVRKEMEKMNRLATVAEIASAVAHEVRNPLAGIKIMAQSIEEDSCSDEERMECAQRIIRQVDRLNELLTDFFSYARPVVPKKQSIALQSILAETKPLIVNKLVKQRISLHENLSKDLPRVMIDPNQIQQVFLNLFLNSIDAIKQEGTIEISAYPLSGQKLATYRKQNHLLEKNARYVMVIYKDNGAGMSKEAEEKVFEPFFTTKTNGSGLGMSIVYRTLKENDATISVKSSEGQGTTFTMFFKAST